MMITKRIITASVLAMSLGGLITPAFYASAVAAPNDRASETVKTIESRISKTDAEKKESAANARKTACLKVRASIANRTANLQEAALRHMAVIDRVYGNLNDFMGSESLQLTDAQKQAVSTAAANAKAAIQKLGDDEDALNCEDTNVGQMAAIVRLSIQNVHDLLKQYKDTVKEALHSARTELNAGETE